MYDVRKLWATEWERCRQGEVDMMLKKKLRATMLKV